MCPYCLHLSFLGLLACNPTLTICITGSSMYHYTTSADDALFRLFMFLPRICHFCKCHFFCDYFSTTPLVYFIALITGLLCDSCSKKTASTNQNHFTMVWDWKAKQKKAASSTFWEDSCSLDIFINIYRVLKTSPESQNLPWTLSQEELKMW